MSLLLALWHEHFFKADVSQQKVCEHCMWENNNVLVSPFFVCPGPFADLSACIAVACFAQSLNPLTPKI